MFYISVAFIQNSVEKHLFLIYHGSGDSLWLCTKRVLFEFQEHEESHCDMRKHTYTHIHTHSVLHKAGTEGVCNQAQIESICGV